MTAAPRAVGIDAGASFTRVAAGPPGRPTTIVRPTVDPRQAGWDDAVDALDEAIGAALGGPPEAPARLRIVAGIAGAGAETAREQWVGGLRRRRPGAEVDVLPDHALLLACHPGPAPVVGVIVGTGAVVAARAGAEARVETVDGWGPLFGDGGSGFDLGRRAIIAALDAFDGRRPETALTDAVERRLGLDRINAAPALLDEGGLPVDRIASLAPTVLATAAEGDPVAVTIAMEAAVRIADAIATAVGRLAGRGYHLVVGGGVLTGSIDHLQRVLDELTRRGCAPIDHVVATDLAAVAHGLAVESSRSGDGSGAEHDADGLS